MPTQAMLLGQIQDVAFLDFTAMNNAWAVAAEPAKKYSMINTFTKCKESG